jgi:hypothetical protein
MKSSPDDPANTRSNGPNRVSGTHTLLEHDIEQRSRVLARHGLRRVLDELHPRIRWARRGLSCADRSGRTVEVDKRARGMLSSRPREAL